MNTSYTLLAGAALGLVLTTLPTRIPSARAELSADPPAQPTEVAPTPAPPPVAASALPPAEPPAAPEPPVVLAEPAPPPATVATVAPPPAASSPASVPPRPPDVTVTAAAGDGATVKAGDGFSLNLKSRFQLRHQLDIPPENEAGERNPLQTVGINTARVWLSGHAYRPEFKYMLQLAFAGRDFRDGATSPVYDAYVDWKVHRDFSVRAGQFFVPFDRLRTVREWGLQMAERPRPVAELTLDRDVGVAFYSDRFLDDESPVAWRLGAFGGGGTNLSLGKEPGALLVARVELRPLGEIDDDMEGDLARRPTPGLAVGAGVAQDWNTNRQRSTSGPTFVGGTTDTTHAALDLVWKWLGLALEGEFLWKRASSDSIVSVDEDGATVTEFTRSGQGWVVQASYVFDPPLEIVGRLARLDAEAGTDPAFVVEADDRGQEIGAGLNYYLNGHKLKVQTTWIARTNPDFDFGEATHGFSTQLDATF